MRKYIRSILRYRASELNKRTSLGGSLSQILRREWGMRQDKKYGWFLANMFSAAGTGKTIGQRITARKALIYATRHELL